MVANTQRGTFVGGSDARIIMGRDEEALLRLWREKRREAEPEDLSRNLIVQLGIATERLNREWFEAATGQNVTDVQKHIRHPGLHWMGATLDGRIEASGAVFEGASARRKTSSRPMSLRRTNPQILPISIWTSARFIFSPPRAR
jgi:predicted phage-related endonuclease